MLASYDHDEHPDLGAVVDGRIVAERNGNGETADALLDIRSAGKSVTSLPTGIAFDRGRRHSIDNPVARYWSEAARGAIGEIRLRDVLTMRSGLATFGKAPSSPGNLDGCVA